MEVMTEERIKKYIGIQPRIDKLSEQLRPLREKAEDCSAHFQDAGYVKTYRKTDKVARNATLIASYSNDIKILEREKAIIEYFVLRIQCVNPMLANIIEYRFYDRWPISKIYSTLKRILNNNAPSESSIRRYIKEAFKNHGIFEYPASKDYNGENE